tara:strand:+ start:58558 stop:59898 length:1341 start_codon:yes stop_codon:yes gene_type:complete
MKQVYKIKFYIVFSCIALLSCEDTKETIFEKNAALVNLTAESAIETVNLKWDLPAEEVNNYIISYTPGDIYFALDDGTQNELTISGLDGEVAYTFTISWLDVLLGASNTVSISETPKIRPPGTFTGDLIIGNQSELDNLELPNEASLEVIAGNLKIISDGSDNILDLSKLENLKRITGSVEIKNNPILSNLSAFISLVTIEGGAVDIENNRNLINFCGLENIPTTTNTNITSNGFNPTFSEILAGNCKTEDLIYDDPDNDRFNTQAEVDALPDGITHFVGELVIGLDADSNDITDLSKFSKLRHIGGRFIFQRTPFITDLTGFRSLEFVGNTDSDEFLIRQTDGLVTLDGLQALTHVGRRIGVRENPNLTTLEGLNNIRTIGENKITIGGCGNTTQGNPLLTNYCALEGLIKSVGIPALEAGGSCIDSYSSFNPNFQDILNGNCEN